MIAGAPQELCSIRKAVGHPLSRRALRWVHFHIAGREILPATAGNNVARESRVSRRGEVSKASPQFA